MLALCDCRMEISEYQKNNSEDENCYVCNNYLGSGGFFESRKRLNVLKQRFLYFFELTVGEFWEHSW